MMNFNIQLFADNLQNTTATMSKEMKTCLLYTSPSPRD